MVTIELGFPPPQGNMGGVLRRAHPARLQADGRQQSEQPVQPLRDEEPVQPVRSLRRAQGSPINLFTLRTISTKISAYRLGATTCTAQLFLTLNPKNLTGNP